MMRSESEGSVRFQIGRTLSAYRDQGPIAQKWDIAADLLADLVDLLWPWIEDEAAKAEDPDEYREQFALNVTDDEEGSFDAEMVEACRRVKRAALTLARAKRLWGKDPEELMSSEGLMGAVPQ